MHKHTARAANYRSSFCDLVVWGLAGLVTFLYFWPPFLAAAKSGDVVRVLGAKAPAATQGAMRPAPAFPVRKDTTKAIRS